MKKLTQTQAVIEVMRQKGGYSTLLALYDDVLQTNIVEWKTKTPDASIRRIVQDQRYFFKIRAGLWALNEYRDKLPQRISDLIESEQPSDTYETNLHSYNQGLLINSGNMLGYKTYVPAQDQNRIFLDTPLKSLASYIELPHFTYDEIINRIKSIDVMWLDGNVSALFPKKVFEVENTTDFSKSLNKFSELGGFSIEMVVVAPRYKEKQFYDTLNWKVYKDIKDRVQFWDYEMLERTYHYYRSKETKGLLF